MGKQPPLEDVFVTVAGSPTLGEEAATLVLVEFSDYQCPYCGAFARQTFPRLIDAYVKTGKMRYVLHDFPLEEAHPLAEKAAEAAHCASEQGQYWEAHERFFNNQQALAVANMRDHATALGLNPSTFQDCLDSGKYASSIERSLSEGEKLGVRGTPMFFLGYVDPKHPSRIQAVKSLNGAQPFREFQSMIDALLNPPQAGARVEP
jgi:protein-disulfide isomerase